MRVTGIPKDHFPAWYPSLEWAFQSFAERSAGDATAEDLAGQVMAETSQCWIVWDNTVKAVALTEVQEGRKKAIVMTHCAGEEREDWQEMLVNTIRDWARSIGAEKFGTVSRPGWTPFLKQMGLRETHRVMEQSLE